MSAALAPVEAWPAERTAGPAPLAEIDAKAEEELFAMRRDDAAVIGERDTVPLDQGVRQRDAEASRQMIVAGAGVP
jgi:hypothetical protein